MGGFINKGYKIFKTKRCDTRCPNIWM